MADRKLSLLEKEIALLPDELHRNMELSDRLLSQLSEGKQMTQLEGLSLQFQLKSYEEFLQKLEDYREKLNSLGITDPGQVPGGMSLVLLDQLAAVANRETEQLLPLQTSLLAGKSANNQEKMAERIALKERLSAALKKTNEGE